MEVSSLDRKNIQKEMSSIVSRAKLMSTSIHFPGTVYKEKMSIYPIINYLGYSLKTQLSANSGTVTHVTANVRPDTTTPVSGNDGANSTFSSETDWQYLFTLWISQSMKTCWPFSSLVVWDGSVGRRKCQVFIFLATVDRCCTNSCKKFVNTYQIFVSSPMVDASEL